MNKKIKIAFVKFGGCCAGGTEKYIQTIAAHLPKNEFEVDYYYCDSAPYIGSDWLHPDTEPGRVEYLEKHGVNLVKFDVAYKDITKPTHPWIETDFWSKFNESKYDIISTGRAGHAEYPFTEIQNTWIVDIVTLPNMAERKQNIYKTIHISQYQMDSWISAGGDPDKGIVFPLISDLPEKTNNNLKEVLGIPQDAFVYGLHQRANDGIYSPVALNAFSKLNDENSWFILMGGSSEYSKQAKTLGIKNFIQLEYSGDLSKLDLFLNTLDVYAHARADGETFGLAIAEAMSYGLPVISHTAPAMGHVHTIRSAGFVCNSEEEYLNIMKKYKNNEDNVYINCSQAAIKIYKEDYDVNSIVNKITQIYRETLNVKKPWDVSDEDFWNDMW